MPEGRHVFPGLSVEKNLMLGAYAKPWDAETRAALGEVYELFPVLGEMRGPPGRGAVGRSAADARHRPGADVAAACCCSTSRRWACRPSWSRTILAVLQRLTRHGLSMLLVEQNAKLTFEATSTCLVMEHGEVAMSGTSAELTHDARVRQIYLGL